KAASKKKGGNATVRPSGLVRIRPTGDRSYVAEAMPDLRDWLNARVHARAPVGKLAPDEGGLNVEGLAWDSERHALLFGIRTPVLGHNPLGVPVRIKELA